MPLTLLILGIAIFGFLLVWSSAQSPGLRQFLFGMTFFPPLWTERPWTLLTYPFIERDFLALVFVGIGLYFFAGALERLWGTKRYGWFFLTVVISCALTTLFVLGALNTAIPLAGMAYPIACVVVAFCSVYPNQPIMLWMVLPIAAKWIGWLTALGVVFSFGNGAPFAGIIAAIPVVLCWAYASGRLKFAPLPDRSRKREGDYRGFDENKRLETEKERRKLKELFERSFNDDGPKDK